MDNILNKKIKIENILIFMFINIFIISQFVRKEILDIFHVDLRYYLIPIICIFMVAFITKKVKGSYFYLINFIIILTIISKIYYNYSLYDLIRGIMIIMIPTFILCINLSYKFDYVYKKILKIFNIYIYISVFLSFIEYMYMIALNGNFEQRVGGIIGHSLTAGVYYLVFLILNNIDYKYFNSKKDIYIIIDIILAIIGCLMSGGRVATILVILQSLIYVYTCIKNRVLKFIIFPIIGVFVVNSKIFYSLIWSRFIESSTLYGDFTNGRLLSLKALIENNIKPNFLLGFGNGYAIRTTWITLQTSGLENPIIMFIYDYGILTTLIIYLLILVFPVIYFIKAKNKFILIEYLILFISLHTFNGIAESTGLYFVLLFILFIFKDLIKFSFKE